MYKYIALSTTLIAVVLHFGGWLPPWIVPGSQEDGPEDPLVVELDVRTVFDGSEIEVPLDERVPMETSEPPEPSRLVVRQSVRAGEAQVLAKEQGIRRVPRSLVALESSPAFSDLTLQILRLGEGDMVVVRVGDVQLTLQPEEEASFGVLAEEGGYRVVQEEDAWADLVAAALEAARPAAVLHFSHDGSLHDTAERGGDAP